MKEELQKSLEKIGWKFYGKYPNERLLDHDGVIKDIKITNERLEIQETNLDTCFYLKGCEVYELTNPQGDVDCVGLKAIGNNEVFIQFYNHSI